LPGIPTKSGLKIPRLFSKTPTKNIKKTLNSIHTLKVQIKANGRQQNVDNCIEYQIPLEEQYNTQKKCIFLIENPYKTERKLH
jgi:hypothetical protein